MSAARRFALLVAAVSLLSTGAFADEPKVEVGKPAPNFELPGADGKPFELASLKGKRHVVLVFSRGHWCPFCTAHMQSLQQNHEAMQKLGAEVVVVFREDGVDGLEKARKQAQAKFVMLSDENAKHTRAYSPEGYAVYVLDRKGVVRAVLPGTKTGRPSAQQILAALRKLSPKKGRK